MPAFGSFSSLVAPLPVNDIDTDQIIPARFLKTTSKEGLGMLLFNDWKKDPGFVLNRLEFSGAGVLLAGDNFGCGSSREHAPWALMDWGFRAIISTSFADIFCNNALKNGLLPIAIDAASHRELVEACEKSSRVHVDIKLASQELVLPSRRSVTFPIDAFAKRCLLEGVDQLGYLLKHRTQIQAYEDRG